MTALLISLMLTASTDLTIHDAKRDRDILIRVYVPASKSPAPLILFSHGLGGARDACRYLGEYWSQHGYVAVFLQHPGSDETVWKSIPAAERTKALTTAANVENFRLRVEDVSASLDTLTTWNADAKHVLFHRLDLTRVGMAGHSFGAVTTQAVSGQHFLAGRDFTDVRIKAAVMLSPSIPKHGDAATAFGKVSIPWLLITGTRDDSPIGDQTAKTRLGVFPALPTGQKYQLVLADAEHSAFTDRPVGDKYPRNPNHHRLVQLATTAFFDSVLKGDATARASLDGDSGLEKALQPGDTWAQR